MDKLERLTAQLMQDPRAANYVDALHPLTNLQALAEKYAELVAHDSDVSRSYCLAAEFVLRNRAVTHFHEHRVLAALSTLEKAQKAHQDHQRKLRATKNRKAAALRRKLKKGSE